MTAKYFAILTNQGAARLANAAALGTKLNLTQMAVGDANGTLPTPDPAQTKLINQKRIAPLNLLTVDPANTSQIIAEQIIPENEGGFWIREIGLYDDDGILIAVANCPETYKPQLQEGSGRTQTIRMILIVSSTSAITLKIDPSVVLATRQYVDDKVIEVKAYADDLMKKHVDAANPHKQYPLIANALKEMVDAGLINEVIKNLGLSEVSLAGTATGVLGSNGYFKLPGVIGNEKKNLIIQWMKVSTNSQNGVDSVFNWPVSFPTACLNAQVTYSELSNPYSDITTPIFITGRSMQNITIRSYTGAGNGVDVWGVGY
ncbi:MAG: phage tail protein [Enterobacterales bacterium endosymbiont of Blomia tropicalis]|uniref:phage tail protein n=1 Tax=Mixta mediterraneensis TaxID=2758443 RepID=UPI0025A92B50|nr:phage tail protein [Mixta mediterraneensis]MDL4913149.1 phage tail protein [Mixta mediterraneensis]